MRFSLHHQWAYVVPVSLSILASGATAVADDRVPPPPSPQAVQVAPATATTTAPQVIELHVVPGAPAPAAAPIPPPIPAKATPTPQPVQAAPVQSVPIQLAVTLVPQTVTTTPAVAVQRYRVVQPGLLRRSLSGIGAGLQNLSAPRLKPVFPAILPAAQQPQTVDVAVQTTSATSTAAVVPQVQVQAQAVRVAQPEAIELPPLPRPSAQSK